MKTLPAIDDHPDPALLTQENVRLRGDLLTLATRINHDLRTPIGSISTLSEMLKETLVETSPADAALVSPIFAATEELARLLERTGLLLRASVHPDPKIPVAVDQAVSAALQRLERRILARRAVISQPAAWPEVDGVARWLETIWWNLIANALQHGRETPHIDLSWRRLPGQFRFWVDDDGNGVPPEARRRLFQPFHTLHEPSSTRGLGLSIVQRLTELQGGTCGYEPRPGGGARFYFTLPDASNENGHS